MDKNTSTSPLCIVIAGPNGAGKTTFAREFLPREVGVLNFINVDLIAAGLSPFRPESVALAAGRLFLEEVDRHAEARADFAFETTLSGLAYLSRLKQWKAAGYRIELVFLRLSSPQLSLRRIAARVKQGGHNVPRADVIRRFSRGLENLRGAYCSIADAWSVYENSGERPTWLETGPSSDGTQKQQISAFAANVGRALRRAGRNARKIARAYGTPVYLVRDGKIVAEKP